MTQLEHSGDGQKIAHYRITAAIGAGGMGQVYRAPIRNSAVMSLQGASARRFVALLSKLGFER